MKMSCYRRPMIQMKYRSDIPLKGNIMTDTQALKAEPVYKDDIEFVRAVVESGMMFMLKPDEGAIAAYIEGMAVVETKTLIVGGQEEEITLYVLPQRVYDCLPALGITTVTKATISDNKLQD